MNFFEILNTLRREEVFDFVGLHPQLCSDDGDEFLKVLVAGKKFDQLYVAGCGLRMQQKMFRDAFDDGGFDRAHHFGVDIRNMQTEDVINAIKKLVEGNGA